MKTDRFAVLARQGLEDYLSGVDPFLGIEKRTPIAKNEGGVFITILKDEKIRGKFGSIYAINDTLEEEIVLNTIRAGVEDPEREKISLDELSDLTFMIDFVFDFKEVEPDELDPRTDGVFVSEGWRKGYRLPQENKNLTVDEIISAAIENAGIDPSIPVKIERFRVEHYE